MPVQGTFGQRHFEDDGVLDEIANDEMVQRAGRDGRAERERVGVERRNIDVEIDGAGFAGDERRQGASLTGGVGSREIDAQLVAEQDADDGLVEVRFGAGAYANNDGGIGFNGVERAAGDIANADADNLCATVAGTAVDEGDPLDDFHRCIDGRRRMVLQVDFAVVRVFRGHGCQVLRDDRIGFAQGHGFPVVEPQPAVAQGFYFGSGVRDEQDGDALRAKLVDFSHAALAEIDVPYGERFVDQENFGIHIDGDGERQTDDHAAGVGLHGLIDELADFRELGNFIKFAIDLLGRETKDRRVQINVLASGEFGIESGAQFQEGGHASVYVDRSGRRLQDAGANLK